MKKILILLITVAGATCGAFAQPPIDGFTYVGELDNHNYYVSQYAATWSDADSICTTVGGHLICIGSQAENDLLWSFINEQDYPFTVWIGFSDEFTEGDWRWVNAEPVTYTNWADGQPDNSGGTDNADYGYIGWYPSGTWDDFDGEGPAYAALEVDNTCPPTPLPFIDNFDSPELDSCWYWIREDGSNWNLTENLGWLRIYPDGRYHWDENDATNILLRPSPIGNYRLQTKVFETGNNKWSGLIVYDNDSHFLSLTKAGSLFRFHHELDDTLVYEEFSAPWLPAHLRIDKYDNQFFAYASQDSLNWEYVGTWSSDSLANANPKVGIACEYWGGDPEGSESDFDYFSLEEIPGTTVCGNVSGVWDSTGSPYYVTCDVTVPAGETLEIQPGVEVLFTGHYKFNVNGNLQAIGTEQDSIKITRAFPTEESKWNGFEIVNTSGTVRLNYCQIEQANRTEERGGGLYAENAYIIIENCLFRDNTAANDGGAIELFGCSDTQIKNTIFKGNIALDQTGVIGPGAVSVNRSSNCVISYCIFDSNHSEGNGGALGIDTPTNDVQALNCTFVRNTCSGSGSAVYAYNGSGNLINCIVYINDGQSLDSQGGTIAIDFSDVQGGYPGTENIDEDPHFVDPENGDFHLTASSPCIDAGDPSSPVDPDSTIADMGAFYYPQPNLLVDPTSLNFGLLDLGTDSTMMISFYNPSVLPVVIDSFSNSLPIFVVDTTGLEGQFDPQSTFDLPVTFFPSVSGTFKDTIVVIASIVGDDTIHIPLRGEAALIPMPVDSLVINKGPLNGIQLDWAPVTETTSGQPLSSVSYIVYGTTDLAEPFQPFGFTSSTTYQHPFILNTQDIYFYYVEPFVEGERGADDVIRLMRDASTE